MSQQDVDAFLEHYGKKGMKWGVTTANPNGVEPSRKMVRQVKKETRKEYAKEYRGQLKSRSGGEKAKTFALDMATMGGYTTAKLARQEGFSKGKAVGFAMLTGPYGQTAIHTARVNQRVHVKLGG